MARNLLFVIILLIFLTIKSKSVSIIQPADRTVCIDEGSLLKKDINSRNNDFGTERVANLILSPTTERKSTSTSTEL